jgi:tetratricopeptide (TPR) repeat protein/CHAT domain-containing protein
MKPLGLIYILICFSFFAMSQNDTLGNSEKINVLKSYKNRLIVEEKSNNLSGMADSYYEIGAIYEELKNYSDALFNTQRALELYIKLGNTDYVADAYLNLGNIYYQLRESKKVISSYENALEIFKQKNNTSATGRIYMNIANEYFVQKMYETAIEYYKKGVPLLDNIESKAKGYKQIAITFQNLSLYNDAINSYLSSVIYLDKLGKEKNIAESYCFIANLHHDKGDYTKSNEFNFKVIGICEKLGIQKTMIMAQAYNGLGQNYHVLGEYVLANTYHLKSLEISILLGDARGEAASYTNLGNVYFRSGNYIKALECHQRSLMIKDSVGLKKEESISYNNIGLIYSNIGNYTKAIEYFEKSIGVDQNNKNSSSLCGTYINIGGIYSDLGNKTKAMEYYSKALEIAKKTEQKKYMAGVYNNIANVYNSNGEYKKAIENINKSLEISEEIKAYSYSACSNNALGEIYFNQKLYLKAKQANKKSYELFKNLGEKKGMLNSINDIVKNNIASNDYNEALVFSNLSMEIIQKEIAENISVMNENERELFWKDKEQYFNNNIINAVKSYIKEPSVTELGYNSLMSTKAFLMEASLNFNSDLNNSKDSILINLYQDLKSLRKYQAKLMSENNESQELISVIENQADSIDQLLSRKMSSYADYKKNFTLTWKDVQSNLSNSEASIEFARYYDDKDSAFNYMALIVKSGDKYPALVKICSENELKKLSPDKELGEIYSLVWKPISNELIGINTIYYTPSGLLNNIPFQALYKFVNGKREYVMDEFTLHQLTSTRYLAMDLKKKELQKIDNSIALFGGINYNDLPNSEIDILNTDESSQVALLFKNAVTLNRDFENIRTGATYLPGSKTEINNIGQLLKNNNWNVEIIEGKNASENKIKSFSGKNCKSILHIATHGFAYPDKEEKRKDIVLRIPQVNEYYKASDNPMIRSGLLFGGANLTWQGKGDSLLNITNEDGVLTAYELSQLDLSNTNLAVLSACETGKGAIQGSEGTFGLKRALKLAGIDNIIVSLWKVPDEATSEMMTLFYSELAKTKFPVKSFEKAQKQMRDNYPDEPKKWAGFVFIR